MRQVLLLLLVGVTWASAAPYDINPIAYQIWGDGADVVASSGAAGGFGYGIEVGPGVAYSEAAAVVPSVAYETAASVPLAGISYEAAAVPVAGVAYEAAASVPVAGVAYEAAAVPVATEVISGFDAAAVPVASVDVSIPVLGEINFGRRYPIVSNEQIASLFANGGANSAMAREMANSVNMYFDDAVEKSRMAVATGMNDLITSAAENYENIANIRNSLANLIADIQRDQATAVKAGLASLLVSAGESQEKTNLIAEQLSNQFITTTLNQQNMVNDGVNSLIKTNVGNMANADLMLGQLTEAFVTNQQAATPMVNAELNALTAEVAAKTPQAVGGAVLDPKVNVGAYIEGSSGAAVGNPQLTSLAESAGNARFIGESYFDPYSRPSYEDKVRFTLGWD